MDALTKNKLQMFGIMWGGIGYAVLLFGGWGVLSGYLTPPTSPSVGAAQIAAFYADNLTAIRVGLVLTMFAALAFIPFAGALTQIISKIEGGPGVLTYSVLIGALANGVLTYFPAIWYLTAAFRPDRPAELIQLMNDQGWLEIIGGASLTLSWPLGIAAASLLDKSSEPVFPRWVGWLNLWVTLAILPDQLLFFFHSGPFAWNGIVGLWIPLACGGAYYVVDIVMMRRALLRDRARILQSATSQVSASTA